MTLSRAGIEALKGQEAFRAVAYRDEADVWTIGYGETEGVKPFDTITEPEALDRLHKRIRKFEIAVSDLVSSTTKQHEFDALVLLTYNIGVSALKSSTLLRKFLAGKKAAATAQFSRWNKVTVGGQKRVSRGLADRRSMEAIMFAGED